MRFLVVTQKIDANDRNLGFFVSWIKKFAEKGEVTVIANEVGVYVPLPKVTVFSLQKEQGASRIARFFRYQKFLISALKNADGVFFHMCPEYVLGAHLLPLLYGKKSVLWYVHKEVSWRLRISVLFVNKVFTASKESFRLASKKVEVVGHGIPTDVFSGTERVPNKLHLVTVGRVAPVKDLETLVRALMEIKKTIPDTEFSIIGEPITERDRQYQARLAAMAPEARFNSLPYGSVFSPLHPYTVFIHASKTGSMDKAVLEALFAGLPVFTSSEAFRDAIPGITKFKEGDPSDLAQKLMQAFTRGEIVYTSTGREWVREHHNLDRLIARILSFFTL